MFERSDDDTRTVIDTAGAESKSLRHSWIGTEHVLLALVIHNDLLPPGVAQLLPSAGQVRQAIGAAIDPGPPAPDAELLGSLGIDLDLIRAAVRTTFGPEALDRLAERRVHQPWQPWRRPRRECVSVLAGRRSIAPRLKQAFEHADGHAIERHEQLISPVALLHGLIDVEDALANRLLDDLGVDAGEIRAAVERKAS